MFTPITSHFIRHYHSGKVDTWRSSSLFPGRFGTRKDKIILTRTSRETSPEMSRGTAGKSHPTANQQLETVL